MFALWVISLTFVNLASGQIVDVSTDVPSIYYTEPSRNNDYSAKDFTELSGGRIITGQKILERSKSPYIVREDLYVESGSELVIEPGVEIRFAPMIGLTVRGIITAKGEPEVPVVLTSAETPSGQPEPRSIRLVDGPSPLEGRIQLLHQGEWRSVCTNSRNWTRADFETACRELGFQGGRWSSWMDRQWPAKPRLLYEQPQCRGTESSLQNCDQWSYRQLGAGVCDYHPDIGIACSSRHDGSTQAIKHWRGVRFEGANYEKILTQDYTLYIRRSKSILRYVEIKYAGTGREYNVTGALEVEGVPPQMESISIIHSAYTGINVTSPNAPVVVTNCTVRGNRGYGIYVNSSSGLARIDNCVVLDNGADGIKYVHHDERLDEKLHRSDVFDLCTFPTTVSQTFPITLFMDQKKYALDTNHCPQHIFTRAGHVLTLQFLQMTTDRNDSASIEIYDGMSTDGRLLARINVRNGSLPQSVTSTRQNLYIKFVAQPRTQTVTYIRITSGYRKMYDLHVTGSAIADNNGRGIAAEKLRSSIHVHDTSISNSNHVAGIHVLDGAADVNVTSSRISFNRGDGINVTHTGGNRNISRTSISSNRGYGLAVWLNDSSSSEYIHFNQTTVVEYSEIFRNRDIGIMIGNSTGLSYVNVTGNWFNSSSETAIKIESSWLYNRGMMKLQIGHNVFVQNSKLGIKLSPALNIDARIEYNHFRDHAYGCILVRNPSLEEFNILPADITIRHNEFYENHGIYVVSIGLSPYSDHQRLLFTRNFLRDNRIREPYDRSDYQMTTTMTTTRLMPRSRVAAVVVVSSSNVHVFRNILHNLESRYEIGSHLEDQSKVINCTYNWLGYHEEQKILDRLFGRKDRYNLARIRYLPYLLHSSNPLTSTIISNPTYVPEFLRPGTNLIGGEIEGKEILQAGEYTVERDINIRPGGKLIIQPGVILKFPPAVGMMVAGKLDARGKGPGDILLTLKEEMSMEPNLRANETGETEFTNENGESAVDYNTNSLKNSEIPVRLLGGKTSAEGRLQIKLGDKWGTVCNYGWSMRDASLICHQLGYVLNPEDWYLERSEIPLAGTSEDIIMSNVRCDEDDTDVTRCRAEFIDDFENSCVHDNDVGVRCTEAAWAGLRIGPLAEPSDLQFITIERAGLLDYTTNSLKPALQIDFSRHSLDNVRINENLHDGLGIIYSDVHSGDSTRSSSIARNSDFSGNRGNGISLRQLGLRVVNSRIEKNGASGIRHDPVLTAIQQREFAGWFVRDGSSTPMSNDYEISGEICLVLPQKVNVTRIELSMGEKRCIVSARLKNENIASTLAIIGAPGCVIGVQLLNPIENRSTENIIVHDSSSASFGATSWRVGRDLSVFPLSTSSFNALIEYTSGNDAYGGAVIVLTCHAAPRQIIRNRRVQGPHPTLELVRTKIRDNKIGIHASYYNRYADDNGAHYLRKSNETISIVDCEISHNRDNAIYIDSPFSNIFTSNISEISIIINDSLVTDNGRGIAQYSRDMRQSNNLFHWTIADCTFERNFADGFQISLPYVWQYNENFTHSIFMKNNTWRNNARFGLIVDGHYANLRITSNRFVSNECRRGLVSIRGMEKTMLIDDNLIEDNYGDYMIEFRADSQSEISGEIEAIFRRNYVKKNNRKRDEIRNENSEATASDPARRSYVVGFRGIQKVSINRNFFGNNNLDYELMAGIRTARINNIVDVTENWWGSSVDSAIKARIFDFDDWNDHAVAKFRPYLIEDSPDSSISPSWELRAGIDLDNLGGRITENLSIEPRDTPYIVNTDITIMPEATLDIKPGVTMEFGPNIGILVLGTLRAIGKAGNEITMRPLRRKNIDTPVSIERKRSINENTESSTLRLCKNAKCSSFMNHEGFLEYYNRTTRQWIPMCDRRFTERNGQVACRQLKRETSNVYVSLERRYELHPGSITRIWSWPEGLECYGNEASLDECQLRLNDESVNRRRGDECTWNDKFIFVHCGEKNLPKDYDYWGGIRIANGEFESHIYENRIHDFVTHETGRIIESRLEHVAITGAGILHNEKSAALQAIMKSPIIRNISIKRCAYHGISIVAPSRGVEILLSEIDDVHGNGINLLSITGEGREADESSFVPLKDLSVPYNIFGMIDICDTSKEIVIEERALVYYKYDNNPVNCVKIFRSTYRAKPFGFRLLQFNLYNSTARPVRPDSITIYDGDIYNETSKILGNLEFDSHNEKKFFRTVGPSLSVKLFANGASNIYGFIAEIVTLPISAIGFNRDVQHNISYSVLTRCQEGAVRYSSAGEINAIMTLEKNQFIRNCRSFYGNFTTCKSSIILDVQNTRYLYFRNNLVRMNEGGLAIRADSRGSATSLKAWINNNLFADNTNRPALYVEGRQRSPYQEVTIFRNYFVNNNAPYDNNIVLKQVVSNMTLNYFHANIALHLLEISGFERVRLPIYQSTSHNGFYKNYATDRNGRSTIVAGTPGQQYVDNVFFNPDNDYEILTMNRSLVVSMDWHENQLEMWRSHVDARHNWWGYNETLAVAGRIRDRGDSPELLQVDYQPYHMNNKSVLNGKCPPAWDLVGDTCYIYIGAPMNFHGARDFCRSANASMPFVMGEYMELWKFLRKQQDRFEYSERVWVQQLERIDQCTMFTYQTIEIDQCSQLSPFICEIDPRVYIDPLSWRKDIVAVGVLGAIGVALALLAAAIGFWISKSKKRKLERLERRNSIRQSLHSLRSVGSTSGFTELNYRRKPIATKQSTDTLNSRSLDYKKMMSGGSIDSMDKSQLNSSMEDNRSYDVYEAHNPRYSPGTSDFKTAVTQKYPLNHGDNPVFDLAYRNEGFRNHSTFGRSRNPSNWQESIASSEIGTTPNDDDDDDDESAVLPKNETDYRNNNASTLPLNSSLTMNDSIIELKRDIGAAAPSYAATNMNYENYDSPPPPPVTPGSEPVPEYFGPSMTRQYYYEQRRPRSGVDVGGLLETNLDNGEEKPLRSKSEALLETNFDAFMPNNEPTELTQLSSDSRSKSQPLETAM